MDKTISDQELAKDIKRLAKAMEQLVRLITQTIKKNE